MGSRSKVLIQEVQSSRILPNCSSFKLLFYITPPLGNHGKIILFDLCRCNLWIMLFILVFHLERTLCTVMTKFATPKALDLLNIFIFLPVPLRCEGYILILLFGLRPTTDATSIFHLNKSLLISSYWRAAHIPFQSGNLSLPRIPWTNTCHSSEAEFRASLTLSVGWGVDLIAFQGMDLCVPPSESAWISSSTPIVSSASQKIPDILWTRHPTSPWLYLFLKCDILHDPSLHRGSSAYPSPSIPFTFWVDLDLWAWLSHYRRRSSENFHPEGMTSSPSKSHS